MYIQACGMHVPSDGSCVLTMSSIKGDSWLGTPLPRDPNSVYIDVDRTTFSVTPVDEHTNILKCMIHADPHLTYIPSAMINFGLKACIGGFLNLLQSKS